MFPFLKESLEMELRFRFQTPKIGNGNVFPFSKTKRGSKQHSLSLETGTCFHFQLACNGGGKWTDWEEPSLLIQLQISGRLMLLFLNGVPGNGIMFPFPNTKHWKRKHVSVSKNKT
jgi:hypothetical protein